VETDSKIPFRWRSSTAVAATDLEWAADGQQLLAVTDSVLRLYDARGRLVSTTVVPGRGQADAVAFAPSGNAFALASHDASTGRSRVTIIEPGFRTLLFSGVGRFRDLAWSPDGRWVLVTWPEADQWIFVRRNAGTGPHAERLRAVAHISDQFAPGASAPSSFPGVAGWCCSR
jgi:WD40 repeat protein